MMPFFAHAPITLPPVVFAWLAVHGNDLVNGLYEAGGAVTIFVFDVRKIVHDKMIRGISWKTRFFFASWGFWNLFYYPTLHQWMSFAGGAALVLVNCIWIMFAIAYRKN